MATEDINLRLVSVSSNVSDKVSPLNSDDASNGSNMARKSFVAAGSKVKLALQVCHKAPMVFFKM